MQVSAVNWHYFSPNRYNIASVLHPSCPCGHLAGNDTVMHGLEPESEPHHLVSTDFSQVESVLLSRQILATERSIFCLHAFAIP